MMLTVFRKIMAAFGAHIGLIMVVLVVGVGGYWGYKHFTHNPIESVTQVTPESQTVKVDSSSLTPKVVEKVISDPKDKALIESLLAENKKLKVTVGQLSKTVAALNVKGGTAFGGTLVVENAAPTPPAVEGVVPATPASTSTAPVNFHYNDWRLDFYTDTHDANYLLHQKFEALATTGRDKNGEPVSLVKLYELGKNGERLPLGDLMTTAIFADDTRMHWFMHTNIQAGLALTRDPAQKTSNGGVVALQWLKRGKTKAPEDITYAVMSPAFFVSQDIKEPGILPVSFNVARIPHQPLTNLWVSPYLGLNAAGRTFSRVGIVFSATF